MPTVPPPPVHEQILELSTAAWQASEEAETAYVQSLAEIGSWDTESNLVSKCAIAAGSWAAVAAALVALPSGDVDSRKALLAPCGDAAIHAGFYKNMALRAALSLSDRIQDEGQGNPSELVECGAWEAARVARREWRDARASLAIMITDVKELNALDPTPR